MHATANQNLLQNLFKHQNYLNISSRRKKKKKSVKKDLKQDLAPLLFWVCVLWTLGRGVCVGGGGLCAYYCKICKIDLMFQKHEYFLLQIQNETISKYAILTSFLFINYQRPLYKDDSCEQMRITNIYCSSWRFISRWILYKETGYKTWISEFYVSRWFLEIHIYDVIFLVFTIHSSINCD